MQKSASPGVSGCSGFERLGICWFKVWGLRGCLFGVQGWINKAHPRVSGQRLEFLAWVQGLSFGFVMVCGSGIRTDLMVPKAETLCSKHKLNTLT